MGTIATPTKVHEGDMTEEPRELIPPDRLPLEYPLTLASTNPRVYIFTRPTLSAESETALVAEAERRVQSLIDAWVDLGPPEIPIIPERDPRQGVTRKDIPECTRRLAHTYRGRANLAVKDDPPWEIPLVRVNTPAPIIHTGGAQQVGDAVWYTEIPNSGQEHESWGIRPWMDFYFPDLIHEDEEGNGRRAREIFQKTLAGIIDTIQPLFKEDRVIEFDPWDTISWLPELLRHGILSEPEYQYVIRSMVEYGYLPSDPDTYFAVLNFVGKGNDQDLSVRAIVSNSQRAGTYLLKFFVNGNRSEAEELVFGNGGSFIEISRTILRPRQILKFLRPGVRNLKGLADNDPSLTIFAEVKPTMGNLIKFSENHPNLVDNGTTLVIHRQSA